MQIGATIRKYRKQKGMTQEEMANRLGVTGPAVNKWENGNSFPDIMLLAPIARLLDISLDTLLSFREELTAEEVESLVTELGERMKKETYEDVFEWVKHKIGQYPNCEQLIWSAALLLDVERMKKGIPEPEKYDECICGWYNRALESKEEEIRNQAAGSLFGFYLRKKEYEKAEGYLKYFSMRDPERKRRQAQIYAETGRIQEAYRAYEELIYAQRQLLIMVFQQLGALAIQERDWQRAHMLVEKQCMLEKIFEMGEYYEVSGRLELAVAEQDVETALDIIEKMLSGIEGMGSFCRSPLYSHMKFGEVNGEFLAQMKSELIDNLKDEESFGFLREEKRWQELVG